MSTEETCINFCTFVMRRLAEATLSAKPNSPLRCAFTELGTDFAQVASDALKKRVRQELVENVGRNLADLTMFGQLAANAMVATVLADSIRDIIDAAARRRPIDTNGVSLVEA